MVRSVRDRRETILLQPGCEDRRDTADIVVANHALFFTDLKIKSSEDLETSLLPAYTALILDEAHVTRVTVAEKYRGLGYGRIITEHMLENAAELGAVLARLEVRETNLPARALYDRLGFEVEGKRIGYYQRTNENAVLMVKHFEAKQPD